MLAFVGAAPVVRIDWTPKAEGATGLAAVASVQADQQVWINEGVVRTRTTLVYSISRAELAQLAIDVPADQKVVNVFDANVRQWSVEPVAGGQRITAELFEPAKNVATGHRRAGEVRRREGQSHGRRADGQGRGVGRQQGVVVVQVTDSLRAEAVKTSGLLQVDAAELPGDLAIGPLGVLLSLRLGSLRVDPRRREGAAADHRRFAGRSRAAARSADAGPDGDLHDREGRRIPAGAGRSGRLSTCRKVRGANAAGATPVQVDTHYLEGAKKTRLVVNLSRKAIGRVALAVQLQKDLHQPELLTPTGKAAQIALPLPLVAPRTAERATGRLVISAPDSLQINPDKTVGLRSISFNEAYEGIRPPSSDAAPNEPRPDVGVRLQRRRAGRSDALPPSGESRRSPSAN